MRKSSTPALFVAAMLLGGCAVQVPASSDSPQPSLTTENTMMDDDDDFPTAAPAFSAHFTDPIYQEPADEFAPFGTDEGWDMLYEWAERRDELDANTTVADLIGESEYADFVAVLAVEEGPGIPVPGGQVDAATIIIGAGFTLLRLTGHIDEPGRQQTLRALDVLIDRYDSPQQLVRQRADLESWRG